MNMYKVTITETVEYVVRVEAASEQEARELALDTFVGADEPNNYFSDLVDRTVDEVKKV